MSATGETAGSHILRVAFKHFNRFMVLLWRLGLGPWLNRGPRGLGRYMVLTHTGRRSGRRYRTPLNYVRYDDSVYCAAGFGAVSDWYRNIVARPEVEVWLAEGRWTGVAKEVGVTAERTARLRDILMASGFAARVAGVNPSRMTDMELNRLAADYRLVRIRLSTSLTGRLRDSGGQIRS